MCISVHASKENPVEAVLEITHGGAEFTLECVGNPKVFRQAVDSLPVRGLRGLVGVIPRGTEVALDMNRIMNGGTVTGIREGDCVPDLFVPTLVELYCQGRFPFDRLIGFYPQEEINRAVEDMDEGKVVKAVLRP